MKTKYDAQLKGHLSFDDQNVVRYINHNQQYWLAATNNPRQLACEYVQQVAATFHIGESQVNHLHQRVDFLNPRKQAIEFRLSDEKSQFDATTIGFYQTCNNVPVWRAGLSVSVKQNPARVVFAVNNAQQNVACSMPSSKLIDTYKRLFEQIQKTGSGGETGEGGDEGDATSTFLEQILKSGRTGKVGGGKKAGETAAGTPRARLNRGRFYVYRYDSSQRLADHDHQTHDPSTGGETEGPHPTLPLPAVPDAIKDKEYYLVAELLFTLPYPGYGSMNWRALVDVGSNTVLYLRSLVDNVNGLVFKQDPITSTGILSNSADKDNMTLNPLRSDELLSNLDAPVDDVQSLRGSFVQLVDDNLPTIDAPTQPGGDDFDYEVRTNNFAAVSAYYHSNNLFATIEDLGFNVASYFDGTSFPVRVDHRGKNGTVNASCSGDAQGDGIGLVAFGLGHAADTMNPIGRAVDNYVHWHEIGGHGILWDHVESPNFGFAHSAGDSLAAIQNDPTSMLRDKPERFRYAPFRPLRRLDRDVTAGWAWGGAFDAGGYLSEEILATTLFRIYRALGGDADSLNRRRFTSRVVSYLILRAVGTLTPGTNPSDALGFCNALIAVDLLNWTSEGIFGGAYNKVIRWAFEKQGLYQPPAAPMPVVSEGAPPEIDVYINDGRDGEYEYQKVHWHTTTIWNRYEDDGLTGHQPPKLDEVNYAYVKIKNRGTENATNNVLVKGFHCLPGAGLVWPNDFNQMGPNAGISVPSVAADDAEEVIVGPFEWSPNENVYGHDCMLMIVSADGDPSNIDNFTVGESIDEWRLVPHDNNVGQRNVNLVPGDGESRGLMLGLHNVVFWAGNTSRRRAEMELKVALPRVLAQKGWSVGFKDIPDSRFTLAAGERRAVALQVTPGLNFSRDDIDNTLDRDIRVELYGDGALFGGMTYRIDPNMKEPVNFPGKVSDSCNDKAQDLLDCLDLGAQKVKKICVKKVSLDIELDNDCGCD